MIGLKRGVVKLEKHNKKWAALFEKEKNRLLKVTGKSAVRIEHIGSTAISGIKAKPVIDVAFGVLSMKDFKKQMKALEKAGYVWRPGLGRIDQHLVFAKGNEKTRTHYLHLMRYGGKIWKQHINFRDILNADKRIAKRYENLKKKATAKFPNDRKQYQKMKNSFIEGIIART